MPKKSQVKIQKLKTVLLLGGITTNELRPDKEYLVVLYCSYKI